MDTHAALALLNVLEEYRSSQSGHPTRPSELAAQCRDPIPAVARRLAEILAEQAAAGQRPSQRVAARQELETQLLDALRGQP